MNSIFENFLNLVRKVGIQVPVIPGIMPITSFSQIDRFRSMAGCEFPSSLIQDLQEVEHRPEEFYRRSLNFSVKQCRSYWRWEFQEFIFILSINHTLVTTS